MVLIEGGIPTFKVKIRLHVGPTWNKIRMNNEVKSQFNRIQNQVNQHNQD